MKEPARILEDPKVSSTARDHLMRARKAGVPLDVDAGMLALQGKLKAPPPASGLALKLAAAVGGGAIAVAAIWWAQRPETRSAPPAPIPTTTASAVTTPIEPPAESQAVDPMTLPIADAGARPAPSVQQEDPDLLRVEMEHLAMLRTLAKTDPAAAAAFADEGNRRFPRGALRPEREAIAVLSLARSGRTDEARSRGDAFLAAHPKGPLADQVREAIGR